MTVDILDIPFREVAGGFGFAEGPVALGDGSVLVCDVIAGQIVRIATDGSKRRTYDVGGGPNGAAIGPDGRLYICQSGGFDLAGVRPGLQARDYTTGSIQVLDLDSGAVETLYTEATGGVPIRGPNDIVFDAHGGFWFTDFGKERERSVDVSGVFYAKADGSLCREVIFPLNRPNGVGLSPDGTKLYVTETNLVRLWEYQVASPGELVIGPDAHGHGEAPVAKLLAAPGGARMFDSMAVDADGNVCIGTIGTGGITIVSPEGVIRFVPFPDPAVANICFGGKDLRTAYVTLSGTGRLAACDWPIAGLKLANQTLPA